MIIIILIMMMIIIIIILLLLTTIITDSNIAHKFPGLQEDSSPSCMCIRTADLGRNQKADNRRKKGQQLKAD